MTIPVLKPSCSDLEIANVTEVLRSGWWGQGPKCEELERRICERTGFKHCVTTNSATAALHLALLALDINTGVEVIMPALTFVSTALAATYCGAAPVFADVYPDTLTINWNDVLFKRRRDTAAVISVDYAGFPAEAAPFRDLPIIEDAAHMPFGAHHGQIVTYSFHPVKPLATGDGGCLLTDNDAVADKARALRWCGIDRTTWQRSGKKYNWDYDINEVGYKYHLNDIQAAIALAQLDRYDDLLARRRLLAARYDDLLADLPVEPPKKHRDHTWHLYVIRVDRDKRDALLDFLAEHGISASVHYKPLTYYPEYKFQPTPSITQREWQRLISLPLFSDMTEEQQDTVVKAVQEFFA